MCHQKTTIWCWFPVTSPGVWSSRGWSKFTSRGGCLFFLIRYAMSYTPKKAAYISHEFIHHRIRMSWSMHERSPWYDLKDDPMWNMREPTSVGRSHVSSPSSQSPSAMRIPPSRLKADELPPWGFPCQAEVRLTSAMGFPLLGWSPGQRQPWGFPC
jgi:hypothetical protein